MKQILAQFYIHCKNFKNIEIFIVQSETDS